MFKRKTIVASVVLALFASGAVAAHQAKFPMFQLLKKLELTTEQKDDISQLVQSSKSDASVFKEDMQQLRDEITAIVRSDTWNAEGAENAIRQRQAIIAELGLLKATTKHDMWSLLTEEQQDELDVLLAEDKEPREKKNRKKPNFLGKLDLSDEQSAQIEAIKTSMKEQREAFKPTRKEFKSAERDLSFSETFSPDAWHDLQDNYFEAFVSMSLSGAEARHQIWLVLDDTQRDTLVALIEEKQEKRNNKKRGQKGA